MVGTRVRYSFTESFRDDKTTSLSETMKAGAFADKKKKPLEDPQLIVPDVPFCTFFSERLSLNEKKAAESISNSSVNTAFPTTPVVDQQRGDNKENNNGTTIPEQLTMTSLPEDFIMVDLKTPFAKQTGENFELGKFFREWQTAPILETFKELPPLEGEDIQRQLDTFESDLNEFDSIVQTLCQSSPNNN